MGTNFLQSSYAEIVGTDQFDQSFTTWGAYVTGEYELDCDSALHFGGGYAERPPNLTELYAAESFMFLLQNGLNTVTGDPRLQQERRWQVDAALSWDHGPVRGRLGAYHAWVNDYITFENLSVVTGPPFGQVEQVNLKYVNTDLARLWGAEFYMEADASRWLTGFASASYVGGRDETRNGTFATRQSTGAGNAGTRVSGLQRGAFSFIAGGAEEALPGISPFEATIGLRLHEAAPDPIWGIEISARLVDDQDQLAVSLLETKTPGFTVWDLRGYAHLTDRWLVIAGVENFGNRTYREHLDFRSANGIQVLRPGANFYG